MSCRNSLAPAKQASRILSLAVLLLITSLFSVAKSQTTHNSTAPDFRLTDHLGRSRSLYREGGAKAIVVITQGNGCPASRNLFGVINEMQKKYGAQGVVFWLLNANRQDDRKSVTKESATFHNSVPILLDPSQIVTETLGFNKTGEGMIINPKDWKIVYQGVVDERYICEVGKKVSGSPWLNKALDQFLAGQKIEVERKEGRGCLFAFETTKPRDFAKGAGKIIADRCLRCHVEGNRIGPELTSYEKAKGWAPMIERVLLNNTMPPWGTDNFYGNYEGEFDMTAEEKTELFHWLKAGAPRGEGPDPLATASNSKDHNAENIQLRNPKRKVTPHHWFSTPEDAVVPPEGLGENEMFLLAGPTTKDFWLKLITTELTNPPEAHHQYVIISSKSLEQLRELLKARASASPAGGADIKLGLTKISLTFTTSLLQVLIQDPTFVQLPTYSFAGGGTINVALKDIAPFVPKGSYIYLATHQLGTGAAEKMKFRLGLTEQNYYSTLQKMKSFVLENRTFTIPANTRGFEVRTPGFTLARDSSIVGFSAHMHSRGDSTRVIARTPDGKEETIFSIPFFSFKSQRNYMLKSPRKLPKGTQVWAEAVFDNSSFNPANPDSTKIITGGDGPDHEVIALTITYADETK